MSLFFLRSSKRLIKLLTSMTFSLLLCHLLSIPPLFAIVTTCFALENTSFDAIRNGAVRLGSALVGAGFALIFYFILGAHPLMYASVVIVIILSMNVFVYKRFTMIASITAFAIMPSMFDHHLEFYSERVMSSMIGIMVSTVVNMYVLPNNFMPELRNKYERLIDQASILSPINSSMKKMIQKRLNEFERMAAKQKKQWRLRPGKANETRQLLYFEHQKRFLAELFEQQFSFSEQTTSPYIVQFIMRLPSHYRKLGQAERRKLLHWLNQIAPKIPPDFKTNYDYVMQLLFVLDRTSYLHTLQHTKLQKKHVKA
ncbi:hypothetical protein DH09_06385 [Bacillaceae bacterium JMAK1]|nr:hypothetical protein DH09_06385 [Bacillaceae bacterium JMAK1]